MSTLDDIRSGKGLQPLPSKIIFETMEIEIQDADHVKINGKMFVGQNIVDQITFHRILRGWQDACDATWSPVAVDVDTARPCPFCGIRLAYREHECRAVHGKPIMKYYLHEKTGCILDGLEVMPEDLPAWNERA